MSRFLTLAALLGGILIASADAAGEPKANDPTTGPKTPPKAGPKSGGKKKDKEKEEHLCKLRLMWWLAPKDNLELGILQENEQGQRDVAPIGISQMQINGSIDYHGEFAVQIMRKGSTGEVDKKGKMVVTWLPYATLPLKPDDTDICAILFDNGKGGANFRIFDFKPATFPYGSLKVVNLCTAKVACSLDGKVILAEPGKAVLSHNSFATRAAPQITMAVQEAGGEDRILFMSRMIMSDNSRSLFFVIERPSDNIETRYEVTSVVDMNPNPAGVLRPSGDAPAGNEKTTTKPEVKGPKDATKATPKKAV
jgi:hypothetical protein